MTEYKFSQELELESWKILGIRAGAGAGKFYQLELGKIPCQIFDTSVEGAEPTTPGITGIPICDKSPQESWKSQGAAPCQAFDSGRPMWYNIYTRKKYHNNSIARISLTKI